MLGLKIKIIVITMIVTILTGVFFYKSNKINTLETELRIEETKVEILKDTLSVEKEERSYDKIIVIENIIKDNEINTTIGKHTIKF